MENLAPAGSMEALEHAVKAGADAVYLGYSAFSARAGAGNFDEEQLREAVRYAHLHHVRVHVTVNTLVKDGELAAVEQVLSLLNELRVDGVLVQDLGVAQLLRDRFPDLPAHASTQMALHNAAGARFVRDWGFTRVVLARECSLGEIALAAKEGIEVEVFGHGAQCVGVSGECLMSSMGGERSGNRGRCAQPCRMQYTYRGKTAAWLSPRDVCLRDDLPALRDAGACSVKLEGRLKRPEYVAVVAERYRKAIDRMEAGRFLPSDSEEQQALRQIFNRGGFMRGYAVGNEDAGVIWPERVNHTGVAMGQVTQVEDGFMQVLLLEDLHDGDGLQVRGGGADQDMIYSGKDVPRGQYARFRLRPGMVVTPGMDVARLTDQQQMVHANSLPEKRIPVSLHLLAMPGEPLTLTATDGTSTFTAIGETVQAARSRALTMEEATRSLEKTGDTCFVPEKLAVETEGAFVAVSALNAIRREALEGLTEARIADFTRPEGRVLPAREVVLPAREQPLTVQCRTPEQAEAAPAEARVLFDPESYAPEALAWCLAAISRKVWLCLPTVCEEQTLVMLRDFAAKHPERLCGVVLGSVGQLGMTWPLPVAAGIGIPVMNRRALQVLLDAGCAFAVASPELSYAELRTLMAGEAPLVVPALGRLRLMLLTHCPARTYLGLAHGHRECRLCDTRAKDALRHTTFTDRRGKRYPLVRERLTEGCRVSLLSPERLDVVREVRQAGWTPLCMLWDEGEGETAAVLDALDGGGMNDGSTTTGHWTRPVE